jgi:hypothetical protein
MLRRVASALAVAALAVLVPTAALAAPTGKPAVPPGPVNFVGIGGLRWSDITPTATPALWQLAEHSALGAMAVRTTEADTCPVDGWLTLNAGVRAAGPRDHGHCAALPDPTTTTVGPSQGDRITVPGWAALIAPNADHDYDPVWGTLAGSPVDAPRRPCGVGPGAAVALARDDGLVAGQWTPTITELGGPTFCWGLLLVDGGTLPEGPGRPAALAAADAALRAYVDAPVPLMVAGIADSAPGQPHLTALMLRPDAHGYDPAHRPLLRSESTRQPGLLQLTDLTPTLLRGTVPADLPGAVLETRASHSDVARMLRWDVGARTVHDDFVPFFVVLIAGQVLSFAALAWAWHRRRIGRPRAGRVALQIGLLAGAVPPASFLANALPWTRSDHPGLVLWCATAGAAIVLALAAFTLRARPAAPAAFLGALTVCLLAADVATGSRLQLNAVFGLSTLVAGRFYGFGNIAFAVFAMAALVTASAVGGALARRGRPRAAAGAIAAIGGFAVLVDGTPGLGTDFGGVLALLPGVALLAALLLGWRLSIGRVVGIGVLAVVAVSGLAFADWLRPAPDRSHLGRFVQQVLDGDGGHVIAHKAGANLGLLRDAPIIVVVALPLLVLVVTAVVRPEALQLHALARAQQEDPALRALLISALTTGLLGFATNDSGVIVPATALITGGPLIATIWSQRWAAATEPPAAPPVPPKAQKRG